ncbi:sodium channel protein Nach-like [Pseudomyrmex gracilis]|uniref:sodium channel protein Nach-like n=1 Tax=Pseudomyrmex gracilis TaxID=219809 RepID=UPI000995C311|nr:sodium channel protein Nach-like [Pseudomyrmex gracilis]
MHETPNFDAVPPDKWLPILHDLRNEFHPYFSESQNVTVYSIITERGVCLSVRNYMSIYVTFEYWMQNNWTVVPKPEIVPFYHPEDDGNIETLRVPTNGMMISVYYPGEVNEYQHKTSYLEPFRVDQYSVSVVEYVTSYKMMRLTLKQRKCKFSEDGGLEMWPVYTLHMCIMECRYRTILQRCGCFPHFARPTAGVPICNATQLRCIATIKDQLFLHKHVPARCNCLPNCNDDDYKLQKRSSSLRNDVFYDDVPMIWFNLIVELPKSLFNRQEVFGFNDFITAVGSAAGLFLGASALSVIEVFYYVTLHMWVYYLKNKPTKTKQTKKVYKQ